MNGSIRSLNASNYDDEIDGDNINVVVRVRPLNGREIKNNDFSMLQFPGDGGIWVSEIITKTIIYFKQFNYPIPRYSLVMSDFISSVVIQTIFGILLYRVFSVPSILLHRRIIGVSFFKSTR